MGTTALRQLLKSLCNNSVWNYAVLWKLRHGSPGLLNWEDGYFNYPKTREFDEIAQGDACCKVASDVLYPEFEANISSSSSEDHLVGLVVEDMSSLQYALGEGVVGKVASERDHCWVSLTEIFTGGVKCPEEWLPQFVSGVKTILLVPVLPHGVLQLGSLEEVSQDVNIIAYIKSKFNCLLNVCGNSRPIALKAEIEAQLPSSRKWFSIEHLNDLSSNAVTFLRTEDFELSAAVNSVELDNKNLSNASRDLPLLTVQDAIMPAGKFFPEAFLYEQDNTIDVPCTSLASSESINASELEIVESKLFELSCLMEELQAYSDFSKYGMGICGEPFIEIMNSYPRGDMTGEPSRGNADADTDKNKVVSNFLRFPEDSELHKALGPAFRKHPNENLSDPSFLVGDTCDSSVLSPCKDPSERTEMPSSARADDAGYLLEAVVANGNSGTKESSNPSNNFKSCNSFSGEFTASPKPQKQSKSSTFPRDDSIPWSHLTSGGVTKVRNADTSGTIKSMTSAILSDGQREGGCDDARLRKGNKTSNVNKRKTKPVDKQKPRPRDRQLIQDRVRELRELIPSGAKCSIDNLLARTIKHMLHLRSVTDHAEMLRRFVHQELHCRNNSSSPEAKDVCENGTSWAFEFSDKSLEYPIVVEDLAYPGHLLIEMLCNEHGLFLEIAEVIRGLDLTILRGVQESRSNNSWARFIVEASKGFHRLDIFWPLMQLLHCKRNPISSMI